MLVSFVVDSTGRPEPATLRAKTPEQDAAFIPLLRDVMATWEYVPARKDGRPVRQVVYQVVVFYPGP